jgi:hypothetical protein
LNWRFVVGAVSIHHEPGRGYDLAWGGGGLHLELAKGSGGPIQRKRPPSEPCPCDEPLRHRNPPRRCYRHGQLQRRSPFDEDGLKRS